MTHQWSDAIHDVDWQELVDLYERAPLAKKEPARLQTAFSHSMFRWFVRDGQATAMALFQNEAVYLARGYIRPD